MEELKTKFPPVLTRLQAAELLNVKPAFIDKLSCQRRIPVMRVSRRMVRFDRDALIRWLEGKQAAPLVGAGAQEAGAVR